MNDIYLYLPPFMEMDRKKYANRLERLYISSMQETTNQMLYPSNVLNHYLENLMHNIAFDALVIEDYDLGTWNRINSEYKHFTNKAFEKYDWEIRDEV